MFAFDLTFLFIVRNVVHNDKNKNTAAKDIVFIIENKRNAKGIFPQNVST